MGEKKVKMFYLVIVLVILCSIVGGIKQDSVSAYSNTDSLVAGADSFTKMSSTINRGTQTPLEVGNGSTKRIAYLKFDLTSLPADAKISNASLRLYLYKTATGTSDQKLYIKELDDPSSWSEGSYIDYTAKPQTIGSQIGSILIGQGVVGSSGSAQLFTLNIGSYIIDKWNNNQKQFAVEISGETGELVYISSREDTNNGQNSLPDWRPSIAITYTAPDIVVSQPAFTVSEQNITTSGLQYITANNMTSATIKAAVDISNRGNASKDAKMIVALYKNNKLLDVNCSSPPQKQQIESLRQETLSAQVNLLLMGSETIDHYQVKVYVWDTLQGMIPLSNYVVFGKTGIITQ